MSNTQPLALYIHIPFCDAICGYCDFTRFGYQSDLADRYLMRLHEDLKRVQPVETIYIGGGTPTSLSLSQLEFLLESISHLIKEAKEITIEANPDSIEADKIDLLLKYGVNRVSLGVQSTDNVMLASIGRTHSFEKVIESISLLREKGLDNISMDLIYGLPHQSLEDVQKDIETMLELNPVHLSLYALTIEDNSAFGRQKVKPAPNELETAMYLSIVDKLEAAGYHHYEVSNFAKKGHESLHNQHYWSYHDFYGIGIGASGKENHVRYTNTVKLNQYLQKEAQFSERIELSKEDEMFETLMMGLRSTQGVSKARFQQLFNDTIDSVYYQKLQPHFDAGLLIDDGITLSATKEGRLMLHDILVDIL